MTKVGKLTRGVALLGPACKVISRIGKKKLVVELPSVGELPYILPLLRAARQLARVHLIVTPVHWDDLAHPAVRRLLAPLAGNFSLMRRADVVSLHAHLGFDGFLTSEQFSEPLLRPAICIFHGQPSKALTYTEEMLRCYDHFCHLGPLHRRALDEFVAAAGISSVRLPTSHAVGYPKSDAVVRGGAVPSHDDELKRLKKFARIVLYAPAFNEYATLRTIGLELIQTLAALPDTGVLVKLAPDSIGSTADHYATGGVDWRRKIEALGLPNVLVARDLDIGGYIAVADVMVTDVSGVGYEFLAVGKPVIYVDCPRFYERVVLPQHPQLTLSECLSRDTINGGRNYGIVIQSLDELPLAVSAARPEHDGCGLQKQLLYNPGTATEALLQTLNRLLVP